jgi:hypothetical protein
LPHAGRYVSLIDDRSESVRFVETNLEEYAMRSTASKTLVLSLAAACLIVFGCDSQPAAGTNAGGTSGAAGGEDPATKPIKKGNSAKTSTGPAIFK